MKKRRIVARPVDEKDSFYEEQALRGIEKVLEETEGKPLDEVRFQLRRFYPFGPQRKGRPYKIWNRLILAKEAELGLEPRRHKKKEAGIGDE